MSILDRLLFLIGLRPKSGSRTYEISESMQTTLITLAMHENRPVEKLLPDLLAAGLTQYQTQDELWRHWESLTPREQHTTALVCLGYTNRQIAKQMGITPETVKYHLHNVLLKFGLISRSQLQQSLAYWNFKSWQL